MASKKKFQMEFSVRSSVKILYSTISTPSGLSEWFANDVNIRGKVYTFFWDDSEQQAELITKKNNQYVKFRWLDEPADTFFELRIVVDDLTNDVSLIVSDFAEDEEEEEESKLLWDSQIHSMMQSIGS